MALGWDSWGRIGGTGGTGATLVALGASPAVGPELSGDQEVEWGERRAGGTVGSSEGTVKGWGRTSPHPERGMVGCGSEGDEKEVESLVWDP